jgi:DEAD/DEAH box helicase domain-containing protein
VGNRTLVFDLETRRSADEVGGWDQLHRLGIAVGVACVVEEGRFEVFREDRVGELVELLGSARLVVGYNVKRFDYAVLAGYTGVDHGRFWPTLDLLEDLERRLGHRVSLNQVAGATLGVAKSGDGLESLEWVRQGRLEEVESYCRKDVEITRDVYLFGRREGFVRCPGENGEVIAVAVDW